MCFVWISEKNRDYFPVQSYVREMAFITEAKGVHCSVRAESFNITEVKKLVGVHCAVRAEFFKYDKLKETSSCSLRGTF